MNLPFLNIANIAKCTDTLGVGKRYIIWVQGCPFKCKNCISPDWIPFSKAHLVKIETLVAEILSDSELEGLTISGGEPMMQAVQLKTLIKAVKSIRPELNVIIFTGFQLARLRQWGDADKLLQHVDVLITGLYIDELNDGRGLRGSSNQDIHFLTDRLSAHKTYFEQGERKLEIFDKGDHLQFIGIPNRGYTK